MASQYHHIEIGARVMVKREQDRIGGPAYPGRVGVVIRENQFGCGGGVASGTSTWTLRDAPRRVSNPSLGRNWRSFRRARHDRESTANR